jgi:AraC-like DNA-binding protein
LEGEEAYLVEGRVHRLLAGDFIVVDAGASGSIDIPGRQRTIGLSVFLGESAGTAFLEGYGPVLRPPRTCPLGKLLSRSAAKYAQAGADRPADAGILIREFMGAIDALAVETLARLDGVRLKKAWSRQELLMRLERARAHLDESAATPMTLAALARVAGMSAFHLSRHFKAAFGVPPMRYHRRVRMEWVAELLRRGAISPSAAADMLDYSDLPTFTRAFKSIIGAPPSALLRS